MVSRIALLSIVLLACNSTNASQDLMSGDNEFVRELFTESEYETAEWHEQNAFLAALFKASRTGNKNEVVRLIGVGVPVDVPDEHHDRTPLMVACEHGHEKVARLLIAHGASRDATDSRNQTALDYALKFEKGHRVWILCRRFALGRPLVSQVLLSSVKDKKVDGRVVSGTHSSGYVTLSELNVDEGSSQASKPAGEYASTLCYPNKMFPYCQGDITH